MFSFLTFIISVIALVLAYQAYTRSGGSSEELKAKVEDLGITTENLRAKTADTLNRMEKKLRGEPQPEAADGSSEGRDEETNRTDPQ